MKPDTIQEDAPKYMRSTADERARVDAGTVEFRQRLVQCFDQARQAAIRDYWEYLEANPAFAAGQPRAAHASA